MKFATMTAAAALALATTGAFAQSATDGDTGMTLDKSNTESSASMHGMQGKLIRTRDITGGTVYTTNEANDEGWDADAMYEEVDSDWNQVGTIEDIVLTKNGEMKGIVAEVGGFADIGDKHVMISIDDVSLVAVDDASYTYLTRMNEEDLEEMESVDEGFWN